MPAPTPLVVGPHASRSRMGASGFTSMQRDWRSWEVLIRDHHAGYISWAEFERNQQLIADNANGKRFMSRGAIRRGEALLPGLLRCARCGKKLRVRYGQTYRYEC